VVEWILDITAYLWLVWLVIVLTAVVVELLTLEFTFLMIAAGALVGGLGANLLGFPWWAQVAAAAIVTALLLLLIRPVLLRTVGKNDPLIPTNVDALANRRRRLRGWCGNGEASKRRNLDSAPGVPRPRGV
jgi:membrane protein implicated in regulation of membrane protease activity